MIRIVGDTCFADGDFDQGFGIGTYLRNGQDPLSQILKNNDDIWLGNLECVVSDTTENKVGVNSFRVSERDFLLSTHLDIYSVANNHAMQHGSTAFFNTVNTALKVSKIVGSNEQKHLIVNHNDISYGILSFSMREEAFFFPPLYWSTPSFTAIQDEYKQIQRADVKMAYVHWGNEFMNYPNVEQKRFAHWLVDIGFDLIIGTHPHVLQGYEIYKSKYIFYSIGNFLFNMSTPNTKYGAIVNVDYHKGIKITYNYINLNNGVPSLVSTNNVPIPFRFENINSLINIEEDNELYYLRMFRELKKYQKKNRVWILKTLHKHKLPEIIELLQSFLRRRIF